MDGVKPSLRLLIAFLICFGTGRHVFGLDRERLRNYLFDFVTISGDKVQYINSPKLNDHGEMVFQTYHYDESTAVHFWDGVGSRTVIESGHPFGGRIINFISGSVALNNNGVIAFAASGPEDSEVHGAFTISQAGDISKVSHNADLTTYMNVRGIAVNDAGTVVYNAHAFSYRDIYKFSDGAAVRIFRGGDYHQSPGRPEITSSGLIAFVGDKNIFVHSNGETRIVHSAPAYGLNIYYGAVNDLGDIVFIQENPTIAWNLALLRNGQVTILPITRAFVSPVQINAQGLISFNGLNDAGLKNARVFKDGTITDVLGEGDSMFGYQLATAHIKDINEKNQLLVSARLLDGREALLLATPVPEPTFHPGFATLIFAAIAYSFQRRSSARFANAKFTERRP
jgi:hypothetical protein